LRLRLPQHTAHSEQACGSEFNFDLSNPDRPIIEQVAFQVVRVPPYASSGGGVGALRVHDCTVEGVVKTCIYASDEEMGLIILALAGD
jgi:hypothetical protein